MVANPFIPEHLVGRQVELHQVCAVLADDGDLLIAGVPGSGRRRLVRTAAQTVGARMIEIDCLRATHSQKFLALLAEGITQTFCDRAELRLIQQLIHDQPLELQTSATGYAVLVWDMDAVDEWLLFKLLLALPQAIAEALNCRVVIVFQNFPHLRTWDRAETWERYLRQEIQRQSQVSYALIATIAESWIQQSDIQVMFLGPIQRAALQSWVMEVTTAHGLAVTPEAIAAILDYVQGNLGSAIALLRRIWLDHVSPRPAESPTNHGPTGLSPTSTPLIPIQVEQVHQSALTLVEDLSLTFEALLLLLPSSQVRVLESLALDPTDSPHSREYIQKHHLSRGGGLQGALASLQQKGLVYGADYGYRIAIPLLAVWLKHRLV